MNLVTQMEGQLDRQARVTLCPSQWLGHIDCGERFTSDSKKGMLAPFTAACEYGYKWYYMSAIMDSLTI